MNLSGSTWSGEDERKEGGLSLRRGSDVFEKRVAGVAFLSPRTRSLSSLRVLYFSPAVQS